MIETGRAGLAIEERSTLPRSLQGSESSECCQLVGPARRQHRNPVTVRNFRSLYARLLKTIVDVRRARAENRDRRASRQDVLREGLS